MFEKTKKKVKDTRNKTYDKAVKLAGPAVAVASGLVYGVTEHFKDKIDDLPCMENFLGKMIYADKINLIDAFNRLSIPGAAAGITAYLGSQISDRLRSTFPTFKNLRNMVLKPAAYIGTAMALKATTDAAFSLPKLAHASSRIPEGQNFINLEGQALNESPGALQQMKDAVESNFYDTVETATNTVQNFPDQTGSDLESLAANTVGFLALTGAAMATYQVGKYGIKGAKHVYNKFVGDAVTGHDKRQTKNIVDSAL